MSLAYSTSEAPTTLRFKMVAAKSVHEHYYEACNYLKGEYATSGLDTLWAVGSAINYITCLSLQQIRDEFVSPRQFNLSVCNNWRAA